MIKAIDIKYPRNHVEPYRIYLKHEDKYLALADIQIKAELRHLEDKVRQEHSLSIYLRPPMVSDYQLYSRDYETIPLEPGKIRYKLKYEENSEYYNPYISWHGRGFIHANAFKGKTAKRKEQIVPNKPATAWRDVVMAPQLVLRAIVPVHDISSAIVEPDLSRSLDLTDANRVPSQVKRPNGFILDKQRLVTDAVMVDIFIHNRAYEIKNFNDIPYPNGTEIHLIGPPLKFETSASIFCPAVSVFVYQPTHNADSEVEQQPLILNGISSNHPQDDIYIQAILV